MPSPEIRLSPLADQDLFSIWEFIADDDSEAADRVLDLIGNQFLLLARSPGLGRPRKELAANVLCFPVVKSAWRSSFLIYYRLADRGIEIVRVLEGHRDITSEYF
ncbi:MAG: type II toxin-antitoxin system RelE/ParE family toxin [Verrucomicrobiia bacterium]|jgi:toxin ParE1/3/4